MTRIGLRVGRPWRGSRIAAIKLLPDWSCAHGEMHVSSELRPCAIQPTGSRSFTEAGSRRTGRMMSVVCDGRKELPAGVRECSPSPPPEPKVCGLSGGADWIRNSSSAQDRQRLRGFGRIGPIDRWLGGIIRAVVGPGKVGGSRSRTHRRIKAARAVANGERHRGTEISNPVRSSGESANLLFLASTRLGCGHTGEAVGAQGRTRRTGRLLNSFLGSRPSTNPAHIRTRHSAAITAPGRPLVQRRAPARKVGHGPGDVLKFRLRQDLPVGL